MHGAVLVLRIEKRLVWHVTCSNEENADNGTTSAEPRAETHRCEAPAFFGKRMTAGPTLQKKICLNCKKDLAVIDGWSM